MEASNRSREHGKAVLGQGWDCTSISLTLFVTKDDRSLTYTPVSGFSLSASRCLLFFDSRSRISSA